MGAQFLCVPWDSEEVRQIAPPATEVVLEVECRAEDISFAKDLAAFAAEAHHGYGGCLSRLLLKSSYMLTVLMSAYTKNVNSPG